MKKIKLFIIMLLMVFVQVSAANVAEYHEDVAASAPIMVSQAKFSLKIQGADYDLIATILDFAPGGGVPLHYHGGHVLVTVLSGEMTLKEKGVERVIKSGESWSENPGNEHSVVNAGKVTTRVSSSMLLPKGVEASTVVK